MRYAHPAVVVNLADDYCIEVPLGKDVDHFALASLVRDDEHAFLRFRQEHLVGSHAGFTLRN